MSQIIWYGAGKNLKDYEKEFVAETGYPVCICDISEQKQGTKYIFASGEERDIVSLSHVEEEYPDYELWLTLAENNLVECYESLVDIGIQKDRLYFFGKKSYRYGCRMMNNFSYISSDNVKTCAHFPYTKIFKFNQQVISEADIREAIHKMEKWRIDTIHALKKGEKTSCEGCSALQLGVYKDEPQITFLGVGPNFAGGTKCNCDCFYCNQKNIINKGSEQYLSNYDVHKIAASIYPDLQEICLADGEPSILPHIEELCDLIDEKGWSVWFNTNAIIYSEKIAETMARNPNTFIAVALDASSPETYKKIKHVDTFERVVDNIRKYREKGNRVFLKYILIPGYNDSVDEMNGFIRIAKDIGVDRITLSQNLSGFYEGVSHSLDSDMSEEVFAHFAYLVARIQEEGLPWDFQIEFISAHDYERIENLRRV